MNAPFVAAQNRLKARDVTDWDAKASLALLLAETTVRELQQEWKETQNMGMWHFQRTWTATSEQVLALLHIEPTNYPSKANRYAVL